MLDSTQSSDGVITKPSSKSVSQTIDGLRRLIADRGFTVFNVIDHSGVAERAGVQMPDSKLIMFGKPAVGAAVMLAAPLAALDIPLKVLVWEDRNGAVSAIMHRCALLPWMTKTGSRTVSAGTGSGADWGFLAAGGAEGTQWWRRAACRHCPHLDRSRPCFRVGAGAPLVGNHRCCCVRVLSLLY